MGKNTMAALAAVALLLAAAGPTLAAGKSKSKSKRYDGTVNSVEGRKIHMTMKDGSTGDWTVVAGGQVTLGTKAIPLDEVKPGYRVVAFVQEDGTIHKLKIVSYPKGEAPGGKKTASAGGKKAPAKTAEPEGRLGEEETVQTNDGKTLVLVSKTASSSGSETYSVGTGETADISPSLQVRSGAKKLSLSSLKPGQKVRVRWSATSMKPLYIEVVGR